MAQAVFTPGSYEGHDLGSERDLERFEALKMPRGSMSVDRLREFLGSNRVAESLAWAIKLNPSEDEQMGSSHGGDENEASIEFGIPGAPSMRRFDAHLSRWGRAGEGPIIGLHGKRQSQPFDSDRTGIFDYEYRIRLPIVDLGQAGVDKDEADEDDTIARAPDFSLDPEGRIEFSLTTPHTELSFDSGEPDQKASPKLVGGLLTEAAAELVYTIDAAAYREAVREGLARDVSSIILGDARARAD